MRNLTTSELLDRQIRLDGDTWRVLGVGACREGVVLLHLASTTRFRRQRNGKNPIQRCDWVPFGDLPQ